MTFFDISRKMLKAGFYKYRLYFLCNLSATALFCCFAVISTNRTFMNASIVNSSISNNIYLPFFLSAVFLVFFLPVSCQAFLASRKQEYGVMFSLGMSRKEAFRNLLFENVIISVLALAIALAAGTVLSFLFFSVIIYAIDVHGVQWQFCPEAYKLTAVLYTVVVAVAFILNAGRLMLDKIGTLLKAQYRAEKTGKIGTFLCRLAPNYMRFHLVEWSFVRRHKKEWGCRYVLASLIIAVSVMLTGVCVTLYPAFLQDAKSYSPYDMVYSEIYGMNQVSVQDVLHILEKNGVKDSLSSTATDFKQRTDLILDEMKSIQSDMKREASATRRAQNSLSKMVASFEQGDKYAETVTKAVTDGATQAVEETVQAGTKAINEVAKKSAKSIEKLEQAANARAKRFMRITKPEVMVNIAIWIAVAVASAIILSFCYEFFTK